MWGHNFVCVALQVVLCAVLFNEQRGVASSISHQAARVRTSTFKAAVYEHIPFLPIGGEHAYSRKEALELMNKSLVIYKTQTQIAKRQGAQIIVFPEDGLYGMILKTKQAILPFLEKIADPKVTQWSPCSDPTRYPDTEVQHALSCMAKDNGVYVVANMGDRVPCNVTKDPKCPPTGHYQYNSDVAFDPEGQLVARYHKTHLFFEPQFDTPKPEVVYFDTPFGRFGMLVCFDLLFQNPAVTMVTEHGVTNIAFPTAWMDALPLLSAIGFHSSFARGLGINFLAANIHLPAFRFRGSGIYTPDGMASYYYSDNPLSPGKLLVSTVNIIKSNSTEKHREAERKVLVNPIVGKANTNYSTGDEFEAKLFDDTFTFKSLEDSSGRLDVCQKNVCCSVTYRFADETNSHEELFAFGVFDGLHTYEGQYYFQICVVVKCEKDNDRSSCGTPTTISNTIFDSLSISGQFQTQFVYPQIIMSQNGQLALGDKSSWSFQDDIMTMTSGPGLDKPLIAAALFGRSYCRDEGVSHCEEDYNSYALSIPHERNSAPRKEIGDLVWVCGIIVFVFAYHSLSIIKFS